MCKERTELSYEKAQVVQWESVPPAGEILLLVGLYSGVYAQESDLTGTLWDSSVLPRHFIFKIGKWRLGSLAV